MSGSRVRGLVRELDGLRGIAILFVMLHHFWPRDGGPLAGGAELAHLGWIGVDLFYVISGFLIAGILLDTVGERGYYRNYLARRGLRVFPLYYLFLIVVFIAIPHLEGGPWAQTEFVQQSGSPAWYALYFGNIREAIHGHEPAYVLAPLWSLSIEEQFYLTFPLVVALLSRVRLRQVLIALLFVAPAFRIAMLLAFPDNERIQYLATPSRMDVLALGCLLALYLRSGRPALSAIGKQRLTYAMCGAIAILAATYLFDGLDRTQWFCRSIGYSMVGLTMTTIVWWTVEHRGDRVTGALRFAPLTALGKICYGVYLLQRPAEVALTKTLMHFHLVPPPGSPWFMGAKLAAALVAAIVSWKLFEKPILKLKRHFESAQHPLAAGPPSNAPIS